MSTSSATKRPAEPVVIKKYANRRLYNTDTSMYVTLDDLYDMIKGDEDFAVVDAKTGEDLTRTVLTQIIFERESKSEVNLLPTNFLKQLIRFYDNNMQQYVPQYFDSIMHMLLENQEKIRGFVEKSTLSTPPSGFGNYNPFSNIENLTKQNMELFQQTMDMFTGGYNKKNQDDNS